MTDKEFLESKKTALKSIINILINQDDLINHIFEEFKTRPLSDVISLSDVTDFMNTIRLASSHIRGGTELLHFMAKHIDNTIKEKPVST